jgi:hypothetical protein
MRFIDCQGLMPMAAAASRWPVDREDAAAKDLGVEGADIERQRQHRGDAVVDRDADQQREGVVEPQQLHQQRRAAEDLLIGRAMTESTFQPERRAAQVSAPIRMPNRIEPKV